MTNIVLVNPPLPLKEMYGSLVKAGNTMPSLGLCFLASYIRQDSNIRPYIIDSISLSLSYEQALEKILEKKPEFVGISATSIGIYNAVKLAGLIKESDKNIVVIIGGPHVTALPEDTISNFPQFDVGVIGEGEATLLELINCFEKMGDLTSVYGIIFKRGNEIIKTARRPFLTNLDDLPMPAWDLIPDFPQRYRPPAHSFKRLPVATMITSRGCPFKCTFCDTAVFGRSFRAHSAEYILKMIKSLYSDYGVRGLLIYDDVFTLVEPRIKSLCESLIEENIDLSWSCLGRVDNNIDYELLRLMKRAGCWQIGYGIESGSAKVLKMLKKQITLERAQEALRLTKKAGIKTKGFFMIGSFGETTATIKETINFAIKLDLDDFQITNFTPFPGSEAYEIAENHGTFIKDWKKMNMLKISFIPKGLNESLLLRQQRKAYIKFYFRPKIIFSNLRMILKNPAMILRLYRGGTSLIRLLLRT